LESLPTAFAPDGKTELAFNRRVDNATVKAIARAFRWQELLEKGTYATIAEIAEAEKINESYIGRVFRLTLLALDLVEGIVNGSHSADVTLANLGLSRWHGRLNATAFKCAQRERH
jgi:hypothetical protein